jgi:flavodoxin
MEVLVAYCSLTGNTKKAAEALARGAEGAGASVVLKRVEDVDPFELRRYRLICIGTPVHWFRPARKVREFLKKLPNLEGKFGVAFSTHGGLGPGWSLSSIGRALRGKGARVLGSLTTVAANYHHRPFVLHKDRPNDDDLRKFEEFGENVAKVAMQATLTT